MWHIPPYHDWKPIFQWLFLITEKHPEKPPWLNSLLYLDFKILSKVRHLEDLQPTLVKKDQTGFTEGANCSNNIRRFLIVVSSRWAGFVTSLDVEKNYLGWVKELYLAAVLINGLEPEKFVVQRSSWHGCRLALLLFVHSFIYLSICFFICSCFWAFSEHYQMRLNAWTGCGRK